MMVCDDEYNEERADNEFAAYDEDFSNKMI